MFCSVILVPAPSISATNYTNRAALTSSCHVMSRPLYTRQMPMPELPAKVGVCLVTSGPGATNLVTGLATANYDSVPLVCFTGQVARHLIGNDAFQEVDIVGITRSITKYGVTVRNREDLGRIIKEAFYIARTGRPGPVLIDLPKDVMAELGSAEYPKSVNIRGYKPNTSVHIGQLKRALKMLQKAKKPLFLAGGGV